MEKPEITLDHDITGYFRTIVKDVVKAQSAAPEPIVEEYVLGLLADSALGDVRIQSAQEVPLAIQLAEAMQSAVAVRFQRLREVGDGVLLLGGLYQAHLVRAGIDDRYVAHIGQTAYGAASALVTRNTKTWALTQESTGTPDIMRALAASFQPLMRLLRDVADAILVAAARSSADVCQLLERWLHTRSAHLGKLLSAQGIVLGGTA
jgi:hypothetical protein